MSELKYTVGSGRLSYSNSAVVYVYDGWNHPYYKTISLKWRWWQRRSPAERIRRAKEKAHRICQELNKREMYINHEAEISGIEE